MLAKWSPLKLATLAILGSLLVALRFFRGFLVIAALIIAACKTSIWPSAILGFVAVGIPIILLGLRSWNRWFIRTGCQRDGLSMARSGSRIWRLCLPCMGLLLS
jgi:hypothetical protein